MRQSFSAPHICDCNEGVAKGWADCYGLIFRNLCLFCVCRLFGRWEIAEGLPHDALAAEDKRLMFERAFVRTRLETFAIT